MESPTPAEGQASTPAVSGLGEGIWVSHKLTFTPHPGDRANCQSEVWPVRVPGCELAREPRVPHRG